MIGLASLGLLVLHGRIAGITGIAAGVLAPVRADWGWRVAFVAGLLVVGGLAAWATPEAIGGTTPVTGPALAGAGILVGIGTRLGNGCTSGHGVCGIGRMSPRSLVATGVCIGVAMATVTVLRWTGGLA